MNKVFNLFGGRKMTLVLIAIIVMACNKWLDLDKELLNRLIILVLGGSGVVALEDSVTKLANKKRTYKKK